MVSENLLKKLEQPSNPVIVLGIPVDTAPVAIGDYV